MAAGGNPTVVFDTLRQQVQPSLRYLLNKITAYENLGTSDLLTLKTMARRSKGLLDMIKICMIRRQCVTNLLMQVVLQFNRGMTDPDGDGKFDCIPAADNFQAAVSREGVWGID